MQKLSFTLLLILGLIFVACSSNNGGGTEDASQNNDTIGEGLDINTDLSGGSSDAGVAADPAQPVLPATASDVLLDLLPKYSDSDVQTTASGLQYVIFEEGSGEKPQLGETIVAHYTGYLTDGSQFDSSRDRDQPFQFPIGQRAVIQGWDEGFALFNPGTKALLIIPPTLGYGAGGNQGIPPNSTLYFDVELLEVVPVPPTPTPLPETATDELLQLLPAFDESDIVTTESGLQYVVIEEGSGDLAEVGDNIVANYTGYLTTGSTFDSSLGGEPFRFPLGQGRVIPGWDEGFGLFPPGTKAILIIPSDLAYGPQGNQNIPPNSTLYFDVELVDIVESPKPEEIAEGDYITTDSGLRYADITEGDGETAELGTVAVIEYQYWEDGAYVSGSAETAQPLTFPVGMNAFVPGIDEGVQGMKVGGVRQIIMNGALVEGSPFNPQTDTTFRLELVEIRDAGPTEPQTFSSYDTTESGIETADITVGDGADVEDGNTYNVNYVVWDAETGDVLDSSYWRGETLPYTLGENRITGWEEGMAGMKIGGTRQMRIPPEVTNNPQVPGTLIFEVEIVEEVSVEGQ